MVRLAVTLDVTEVWHDISVLWSASFLQSDSVWLWVDISCHLSLWEPPCWLICWALAPIQCSSIACMVHSSGCCRMDSAHYLVQ